MLKLLTLVYLSAVVLKFILPNFGKFLNQSPIIICRKSKFLFDQGLRMVALGRVRAGDGRLVR